MAHKELIVALGLAVAMWQLPAANSHSAPPAAAPPGTASTRYCLRVDPVTGSHIETIQCRTREEWSELDVDVDQEWAANGVRVLA